MSCTDWAKVLLPFCPASEALLSGPHAFSNYMLVLVACSNSSTVLRKDTWEVDFFETLNVENAFKPHRIGSLAGYRIEG